MENLSFLEHVLHELQHLTVILKCLDENDSHASKHDKMFEIHYKIVEGTGRLMKHFDKVESPLLYIFNRLGLWSSFVRSSALTTQQS